MKTFLFYDIETSGLNHAFDQVLTFACIRTDLGLNEIHRQAITIRLRKDIIPSVNAFLTHGLTYDELELGINEYAAAIKIHKIFNTPGTISLGYNSLGFDDEFLRFMFYRNLLDPYLHQYGNGCYRMDILPITVIFKLFSPVCMKWPEVNGKPSLKLDLISQVNALKISGRAHEAMSDVEAVIGLSKIFFQQTDIWQYCVDFFDKARNELRIQNINKKFIIQNKKFRVCIMVSASFGSKVNYMTPVVHLGQSVSYKNQSLWLRLDSDDILGIDTNLDLNNTFVIRKRAGDALIVLPALERFWNKMPESSRKTARDNMAKLECHWEKFFEYIQYHLSYTYPEIPDLDPDAALYQDGFFSTREKSEIAQFHKALANKKHEILMQIQSPRIKIIASRILDRNFNLNTEEYQQYLNRLKSPREEDQIRGFRNELKFNLDQGLQELKETEQTLVNPNSDQKKILNWLKGYLKTL